MIIDAQTSAHLNPEGVTYPRNNEMKEEVKAESISQMIKHNELSDTELWRLIRQRVICFGGNSQLRIYGTLNCRSGKRMKKENRVFFASEQEALVRGYRPCGNCMYKEYKNYKYGSL